MRYLLLSILSFYSILIWGQHSGYKLNETLCVWKYDSVKLFDKPQGKHILNIAYGEKVTVIEEIKLYHGTISYFDTLLHNPKIIISGYYIKVKYNEIEGYVFEKYLDKNSPFNISNISQKNILDSIVTISPGNNSNHIQTKKVYDNGIITIHEEESGGESEKIIDPTINENVYNMIIYKELLTNKEVKYQLKMSGKFYSIEWRKTYRGDDGMGGESWGGLYFNYEQGMIRLSGSYDGC